MCKQCGAKVPRALELIEAHEIDCGRAYVKGIEPWTAADHEGDTIWEAGDTSVVDEVRPNRSFSSTENELSQTELSRRLSVEGQTLFASILAVSSCDGAMYIRRCGVYGTDEPRTSDASAENAIIGWQRYSVTFGSGRMGLEFEYDARETRRLVIASVSEKAAALGVHARDVLIGVDKRIVPRATDPLAIHQHLVASLRPVTLHFYRLHQLEYNILAVGSYKSNSEVISTGKMAGTAVAVTPLGQFLVRSDSGGPETDADSRTVPSLRLGPRLGIHVRRASSELLVPVMHMDATRYGTDDDCRPIDANTRCLLNEGARTVLAQAIKPLLRHKPWELVYDSACDGMCLEALYAHAGATKRTQAQILVCRDDLGNVAGVFLDGPIRNVSRRNTF